MVAQQRLQPKLGLLEPGPRIRSGIRQRDSPVTLPPKCLREAGHGDLALAWMSFERFQRSQAARKRPPHKPHRAD